MATQRYFFGEEASGIDTTMIRDPHHCAPVVLQCSCDAARLRNDSASDPFILSDLEQFLEDFKIIICFFENSLTSGEGD